MKFTPIKTRRFLPPQDDLYQLLDEFLPPLKEKDILVITSKIVSIHQGKTVKITPSTNRLNLIKKEADRYQLKKPSSMTIKQNTLTPFAGIDRSNGKGHYILWPHLPHRQAQKIWAYLTHKHQLKNLGIIITDSNCLPLRLGHLGISIGFHGFHPLRSYANKRDIFNRKLKNHNSNLVDALAALSVVYMGEGNEQTPLLIIRNSNLVKFTKKPTHQELSVTKDYDLYTPLLKLLKSKS